MIIIHNLMLILWKYYGKNNPTVYYIGTKDKEQNHDMFDTDEIFKNFSSMSAAAKHLDSKLILNFTFFFFLFLNALSKFEYKDKVHSVSCWGGKPATIALK